MKTVLPAMILGFFVVEPFKARPSFDPRLSMVMAVLASLVLGWYRWGTKKD